ncbi:MAG TPA: protein kinase, partial [Pyrinomonadaceae bacterium]|nr:protein kinase [Pyrinomonadaceae bacterium]
KILDFGLAKLTQPDGNQQQTDIPTRRVDTEPGVVMGTVGYMSPEQLKGRAVDQRSDIFSFGAILYEMLSGRRAFHRESPAETMSAILKEDPPDLSNTNKSVSPGLERLVNHCLEKSPEARFHSARDLAFALESLSSSSSDSTQTILASPITQQWIKRHALAAWIMALVAIAIAIGAVAFAYFRTSTKTENAKTVFFVSPPESTTFIGAANFISPDGRRIVFSALSKEGKRQLWVRSFDSTDAQLLPGTEDGAQAFWSPDSRFIGFFAGSKLKKIDISGGPAITLADAVVNHGGAWGRGDVILFGPMTGGPLFTISSNGGQPTQVTKIDATRNETIHAWPNFLPDGRHFIYLARSANREKSAIYVASVDSNETKLLINADSSPAYAAPGYVLFVRNRTLMAQPLDPDKLQPAGDAFPIAEQVGFNTANALGFFSVSDNGVLVYRTRVFADVQVTSFDRSGKQIAQLATAGPTGQISGVVISPDDKRLAITRIDNQSASSDIWLLDHDHETRFTFDPANDQSPVWSPDGRQIAFNSSRSGVFDLYVKSASGAGNDELLYRSNNTKGPHDWSPDGQYILFGELDPKTNVDLWVLPLFGDRKPFVFLQTPFQENQARFSPSGRWVAYDSNESGTTQVYVRPFPPSEGQWMVSTNGGSQPRWRADGKELFFIGPDRKLSVVEVKEASNAITFSNPKPLFETRGISGGSGSSYDINRDGQRFLMLIPIEETLPSPLTVVVNWTAGLKK